MLLIPCPYCGPRSEEEFSYGNEAHVGVFTEMAGIARPLLGDVVASAAERRHEIVAAVDLMIRGF